uniref:Desmoglein 2 n=1 Tax=Gasterosteus aculeatus aculeatus TaxID=481459 RepID=G3PIH4_GASAC
MLFCRCVRRDTGEAGRSLHNHTECSCLMLSLQLVLVGAEGNGPEVRRHKREWIIAPRQLYENHDYTTYDSIAKINSDKINYTTIFYYLEGPGVDQPPIGTFGIDRRTGFVKIYSILDREKISSYKLTGIAKYADGTRAEKDIELNIVVLDVNDCPPVIKVQQVGSVNESSAEGTVVMKVIATDDDEKNSPHSQIHYSIVEQSNTAGMFFINSQTGEVMVRRNTLDRERQDTYTLKIRVSDLNGQRGGNTGTGEITVKIQDINDNIPTLEKESYEGSIQENTINVEVMRIKAVDMDLIHTDNWLAAYNIVSGNEAGIFSITTDSQTNEGIIMIHKALDYEEQKSVNLQVAVSNKAAYSFGSGALTGSTTQKPYRVNINVLNEKEGPRFQPSVKVVTISEDHTVTSIQKVIANYAAIDSDTLKIASNVRYAKLKDDDNWLIIDERTGDIKLNKLPDRESKFLINGTYYAQIICTTNEVPSQTATGTIAIQVEDFNDHCPELTTKSQHMCVEDNVIYVTAVDKDNFPNSAPFEFSVIQGGRKEKWTVEHFNETTAILRDQAKLWPGKYTVAVEVKDQQGKSCAPVQVMDVIVCNCDTSTRNCSSRAAKTTAFGASGVLLMLLGLLLLLLLPLLLLFCLCGGAAAIGDFKAIPFDTKQQLIAYHTEGQGDDRVRMVELGGVAGGGAALHNSFSLKRVSNKILRILLDNDDDLAFLDDLGPKFKTLAEICKVSAVDSVDARVSFSQPRPVSPVWPSTRTHVSAHTETTRDRSRDHVNINTLNTSNVASGSSTIVQEERITERTRGSATAPRVQVQDHIVVPSQTLLVQQPTMYYAASPMYVVEPNPQMVLVAGGTQHAVGQVGQVGLSQGLVQVSGMQGTQGVVLVDRHVGTGGVSGQVGQGISQSSLSRSRQVFLVEDGSSGREQGVSLAQGIGQIAHGFAEQSPEIRDQGFQVQTQSFSRYSDRATGSNEDFAQAAAPKSQGTQRVVVQRKKVSVTERNMESSTRA